MAGQVRLWGAGVLLTNLCNELMVLHKLAALGENCYKDSVLWLLCAEQKPPVEHRQTLGALWV